MRPDGSVHQYCPPEQVASEMDRLVELHRRHLDQEVAPEVEAAWLHHRFTQIHPFQDGNGRIARALATLVFIREGWFPLVISRDDRDRYIDALEASDRGNLAALIEVFAARQKRAFVSALAIAQDVVQEGERIDQVIAAIGDMFARRDAAFREEIESAKQMADKAWSSAIERFQQVGQQLETSIAVPGHDRRVFVDLTAHDDERKRSWHRWQIVHAAKDLEYFAGLGDFSCWVRMGLDTEAGRSEILLSLHTIGREYRGVVGAALVFFRRTESEAGERQISEIETVCDDVFQINYKEDESAMLDRFAHWLDRGLLRALETWRRGE
ncbi:MAG TPA: Fic family protein [Egibacteraceae bacterium]|nr:Fic family protein [Egibacteraceae bacterium]